MIRKYGRGGTMILVATVLFIISLFLPWTSVLFYDINGFIQEGYFILILFLYPIYTVLSNKTIKPFLGLLSSMFAVAFLIYYLVTMSQTYMGTTFSAAGLGLYVAILAAVMLSIGVIIKFKEIK